MDSSGDAPLRLHFAIGPTSTLGRALALRLIACRAAAQFSRLLVARLRGPLRLLFYAFHPSRPHALLALIIASALALRRARAVRSRASFWRRRMNAALVYEDWAESAKMLEKEAEEEEQLRRRHRLRRRHADLYDEDLVRTKLSELRMRRKEGVVQDIVFCLRTDLVRNLGNMCNPALHEGRLHVPDLIQDYIDEVRYHLRAVCDSEEQEGEGVPLEEKLAFVRETRHAFGRTALMLSGGASLGAFHVGVVRTLIEHHLLPRVVAGASVGSIICAVIATRTWSDLQSFFGDDMPTLQFFDQLGGIFGTLNRLLTKGAVHDIRRLQHMLRELTQNMTFQEAYDLTGRVLGISVCSPRRHEPPRCLNYLTSPHVVIWSAVTASCAFPGLFEAQELMAKDRMGQLVPYHSPVQPSSSAASRDELGHGGGINSRHWRDGSLQSDLPMIQLKELFNVNHFVVSQANPHIAPLLRLKQMVRSFGGDFAAKLARLSEMEVKHRCNQVWELGFPMGGIAKLFAQDWEGDVTIVMPATLAQFAKMIQNPNAAELQKAVNQGRRCTWEKLSAINANCGIELMLDECVSELNRRRRMKKQLETANSPHQAAAAAAIAGSMARSSSGAKRIPSWNCIARDNSWGSLDEEGMVESSSGGPWGGPSMGTVKQAHRAGGEGGSDSETESMDGSQYSWTRAGGPLMRTASASLFIQEHGGCGENEQGIFRQLQIMNREFSDSCSDDVGEAGGCRVLTPRGSPSPRRATHISIFDRSLDHLHAQKLGLHQSKDPAAAADNESCSETANGGAAGVWSLLQPPPNGPAIAEVCLRAFIDAQSVTSENEEEASRKLKRSIVYGSFGSFIQKTATDESAVNMESSR